MAKLKRSALAHYLDSNFATGTVAWFLLGADIDDMSVSLNPDIEKKKNILGQNSVADNGYEPELSADPFYANPSDAIYDTVRDIAMQRKTGDDCKTKILEVIVEDSAATSHLAFTEDVIIKPESYGGGTEGVNIPFTVTFCGNRVKGTVALSSGGVPTFTADA